MSDKKSGWFSFSWFVGLRYAGMRRDTYLLSFLARIAMFGLVLGTALLIVVLSVMNGFDRELRDRILHIVPHITIYHEGNDPVDWQALQTKLEADAVVREAMVFIEAEGLLKTPSAAEPLLFYGVDELSSLQDYIDPAQLQQWKANERGLLVSAYLAQRLGLAIGDGVYGILSVTASAADPGAVPARTNLRVEPWTIEGIYDTGTEIDRALVVTHRHYLQQALGVSQAQGIRLGLHDLFAAPVVMWRLLQDLPASFSGRDWTHTHGGLYEAVQMSRSMVSMLMFVIIAVAVFNVVSTLVLVVIEKKQAIAVLRVQGASSGHIVRIFLAQGTVIGTLGAVAGAIIGSIISLVLPEVVAWFEQVLGFHFLKVDVYPITYIPSDLRISQVLIVTVIAIFFSFMASLFPAWRATRIAPAEVLRYE